MFKIEFVDGFEKSFKKVINNDPILIKKFYKTISLLAINPNYPSLKTHKVNIIDNEDVWVSSVSGDVRIAWIYDKDERLIITCLKLGTHSGSNQIYNKKSN
jgi:mRNA-degrading endonuclease YafQ of YafQ-DinJ toxin-antitoxin module